MAVISLSCSLFSFLRRFSITSSALRFASFSSDISIYWVNTVAISDCLFSVILCFLLIPEDTGEYRGGSRNFDGDLHSLGVER